MILHRTVPFEYNQYGFEKDLYIQSKVPLCNVLPVEFYYILEVSDVASSADLPHSCNARFGGKAGTVVKIIFVLFIYRRRSCAYKAHVTF